MTLRVKAVSASENRLARYLALDEARNRTRLVLYRRMFGRVREIWMFDMGLGFAEGDSEPISEDEYDDLMLEQEVQELLDAEVVEISDDENEDGGEGGENPVREIEDEDVDVAAMGVGQPGTGSRQQAG